MTPKVGEVYILDLGFEGKVRPVVIVSREDAARGMAETPVICQRSGHRFGGTPRTH